MPRLPKPWKRKSDGNWYVQWNGKQIKLGPDKKKAHTKFNAMLAGNEIGPAAPVRRSGTLTIHQLVDDYGSWLQANRAPSSWKCKQYFFRDLKAFVPSNQPAEDMTPAQLESFLATLKIKSPSTKKDKITTTIAMFNWGVSYGLLDRNPLAKMPKPRARIRQDFIPAEQFQFLLDNCRDEETRDFVTVALLTGARAQEMFKFEASHLQDGKLVLWIEDSKGQRESRVVYLPPAALEIVERLAKKHPTGKLFRSPRGECWNNGSIRKALHPLKEKLGMPGFCVTTLRHSFAAFHLRNGMDSLTLAKFMGHTDTQMLAKRYGHLEQGRFLADKARELTMPVKPPASDHPAESKRQAPSDGTEPTGPDALEVA